MEKSNTPTNATETNEDKLNYFGRKLVGLGRIMAGNRRPIELAAITGFIGGVAVTTLITTIAHEVDKALSLDSALKCVNSELAIQKSDKWMSPLRSEEDLIARCSENKQEAKEVRLQRMMMHPSVEDIVAAPAKSQNMTLPMNAF